MIREDDHSFAQISSIFAELTVLLAKSSTLLSPWIAVTRQGPLTLGLKLLAPSRNAQAAGATPSCASKTHCVVQEGHFEVGNLLQGCSVLKVYRRRERLMQSAFETFTARITNSCGRYAFTIPGIRKAPRRAAAEQRAGAKGGV